MIYSKKNINKLKDILIKKKLTISVAESVTGGHLQAALSAADEASLFFQGGITAYNLGQKTRHLKVDPIMAEKCNCVSKEIAIQMAQHVTDLFSSDIGLSITGYAAPLPAEGIEKIFAWFAVVNGKKLMEAEMISSKHKDPVLVQVDYAEQIVRKMLKIFK